MLLVGVILLLGTMVTAEDDKLVCPPVKEGTVGICVEACEPGCKDGELCCSNGCGHVCTQGIPLCNLPAKGGKCKASIKRYFYDAEDNECKIFHYGGCDANENNFEEKVDCEKQCLKTVDACSQPKMIGPCKGAFPRYFYNNETESCEDFLYGGCKGNDNNFMSAEQCEMICIPNAACSQPKMIGPCKGAFPRYFYNNETGKCEDFLYGGCKGNDNNFMSAEQCEMICIPEDKTDICDLPAKVGKCKARIERYFYDAADNECKLFHYGGCDANENNFEEKVDCEKQCLKSGGRDGDVLAEDICKLPKDEGKLYCSMAPQTRYFYNSDTMMCEEFVFYGGCGGGNLNNFEDVESCKQSCVACSQPKMIGPCKGAFPRYYYDGETEKCEDFLYGGCRGNKNNFKSLEQCEMKCIPENKTDICDLPAKVGKCKARIERYFYDAEDNECKLFYYGGCDANENNFEEKADCEKQCLQSDGSGDVSSEDDICNLPMVKGKKKCEEDKLVRYFYNSDTMMCEEFKYSGCGGGNLNNFEDVESCKQSCDACSQPKMIGPCKGAFPRYFYNSETGKCEDFLYGGCKGNKNNFMSAEQCEMKCEPTCEYYCQKCKIGKKLLSRCSDCKQRKMEGYTKCDACVMVGNNYQCFNCKENQ